MLQKAHQQCRYCDWSTSETAEELLKDGPSQSQPPEESTRFVCEQK